MVEYVQNMPATFTIRHLPIKVERRMLFLLLTAMPLALIWWARRRRPEQGIITSILTGWLYFLVLLTPDVVHIAGHVLSAWKAQAPMDAVYVPVGMPRTIYYDNEVPSEVHIKRSLGGPVASLLAWALSVILLSWVPAGSLVRDLAKLAVFGHGLIGLGSLLPLPGVDGAVIWYWWRQIRSGS